MWRIFERQLTAGVEHDAVFADVCDAGRISGGYVMMSVVSAAIATLGLLLSSPAVVIGAMLLSPLMGPIVLLGFAFWTIDWAATRRAVASLAAGLGLALAVAVVLTWASPLKEPTSEILARAHPNLFDLLIAAFSGLAGGYAVIRRRGETVIGVAIATALMPPIAAVGFGVGVRDWSIALGALLLFATNLIAIALAAAGMAALYGFRPHYHLRNRGWIGHVAVLAIVAGLCVPLTLSLNAIALESRAAAAARNEIDALFGPRSRLTTLAAHGLGDGLQIDALVATPRFVPKAGETLEARLSRRLGRPAKVSLDQVVLADPKALAQARTAAEPPRDAGAEVIQELKAATPFPAEAIGYDPAAGRGFVVLAAAAGLDLPSAMALESGLRARQGLDRTEVLPPLQALPPVPVTWNDDGQPGLGPALAADLWALERWRAQSVSLRLCGVAGTARTHAATALATNRFLAFRTTIARGSSADCAPYAKSGAVLLVAAG
ncbi:MAG TPA: DUF389 domain-containing protein [Caulobacteraceae bacterium]|nr:DUF389 domain-containing protein [Caulobacteraceae bacterium]